MDRPAILRAADQIAAWRLAKTPIRPLADECRPRAEDQAYAVQAALHSRLTAGLGALGGFKIGCTTPVMQAYLNIPQPCAGGVFASTVHAANARVAAKDYLRLGVECEIAVRLGRGLGPADAPFSADTVSGAVAGVMAAMELVEDRYEDYPTLGIHALIADDFFNTGAVLAEPPADWRRLDLAALSGSMRINGECVGEGRGADVMGHPFRALAWIAGRFAELGWTLPAGSFVLLGSVVQTHWVRAGDDIRCAIDGLGETHLQVT